MSKKTVCICCKVAHVRTLILLFGTVLYSIVANTDDPVWAFYLQVLYLTQLLLTQNHTHTILDEMEEAIVNTLTLRMNLTRTTDGEYDPKGTQPSALSVSNSAGRPFVPTEFFIMRAVSPVHQTLFW